MYSTAILLVSSFFATFSILAGNPILFPTMAGNPILLGPFRSGLCSDGRRYTDFFFTCRFNYSNPYDVNVAFKIAWLIDGKPLSIPTTISGFDREARIYSNQLHKQMGHETFAETLNTIRLSFAWLCETDNNATAPLLTPSDFTPPGSARVKTSASFTPTTSLLLETAATYSSPVTLYPPLEPVSTVLTSAPRISSKPISTPVLQSLPHDVLLDLTSSTFTPAPLAQPPRDTTSLQPAYSSQFDLGETTSPVLVPPERILLPERQQTVTQTFPAVSETRTFTVQPSSVNFSSPEHYSRSASIFGNNRSTPSGMSSALKLDVFTGDQPQNPTKWLDHFVQWAKFYDLSVEKVLNAFPFHLQGHAKVWYDTLPETVTSSWHFLVTAFKSRFHNDDVILDLSILQTQQGSSESVMDYLSRLFQIATNKTIPDQVLLAVALNGLKPSVKRIVMNKTPTNMAELRQAAVLAEKSIATTDKTDFSTLNTILNEVKQLKDEVKVANSKQTQDSISSIQTHAHINVTKPPFRTPSSNYQTSGQSFRPNTTYTSAPPAFPKSYPSRTPLLNHFVVLATNRNHITVTPPLVLDAENSVDHVDHVVHAMHSATTVTK
ncbi:hypothetical protein CHS0354_023281 [Potamilus streckersoni]|uniref:Retrotransposon gag domain-containing protein n=1 Tax=Potamilus streckersoni TaxID=2493646 RepID=A0AAE0T4M3_9BIVA|nr:hypothetical protein CHS0354_023281 [Potamilus streckersoni]